MARQTRRTMLAAVPVTILFLGAATGVALGLTTDPPATGQSTSSSSAQPSTLDEQDDPNEEADDLDTEATETEEPEAGTDETTTSQQPQESSSQVSDTTTEQPTTTGGPLSNPMLFLTNQARLRAGCPKLQPDPALARAAARHSRDMARNNYFAHTGTRGSGPIERARSEGYPSSYVAENVAAGNADAVDTFVQWMTSTGHRRNILNCGFTEIGIAHVYEPDSRWGHYWTQLLGDPDQ